MVYRGGAKLWEWATNPQGCVLTLLLRQSSGSGGDDIPFNSDVPPADRIAGRWAGDPVRLIGDYDDSDLYQHAKRYRNISEPVVGQWIQFVELDTHRLVYHCCSSCE